MIQEDGDRSATTPASVSCQYCLFLTWASKCLLVCQVMAARCQWSRQHLNAACCRLMLWTTSQSKHTWQILVTPLKYGREYFGNSSSATFSWCHKMAKCSMKWTLEQKISHVMVIHLLELKSFNSLAFRDFKAKVLEIICRCCAISCYRFFSLLLLTFW